MKSTFSPLICAALFSMLHSESNAQLTKGPSSSQTPYVIPTIPDAKATSIISVGDATPNNYRMVGLPDGLGAFDNGNGTFTVLMNHEVGGTSGIARAHGQTGAFVSKWIINKSDLSVLSGSDLMQNVKIWNGLSYDTYNAGNLSTLARFDRFCSADLPAPSAFYNSATGMGTQERIFMNGEESGAEGRAMAHIVTGPEAGTSYQLPRLGRMSFENAVANPSTGNKTVVAGLDDATGGEVYFYIGDKQNAGTEIEKAGLSNGNLYGLVVTGYLSETNASIPAANTAFTLANLGNVASMTGAQLQTATNNAGVSHFLRPEDGAWDPRHPEDFYFVTTNGFGSPSRLWRVRFSNINDLTQGGTITVMLDGTEGQQMFDNIGFDQWGHLILQEDVGNQSHNGKTWQYNVDTDEFIMISKHDVARFGDIGIPATAPFNTDEEASGVINMQDILGAGWFLAVDQAHYSISGELVQGGQMFAFFNPATYNAACAHFNPMITVNPSVPVPGQAENTIYIGYGPNSVSLNGVASEMFAPVEYLWTPVNSMNSAITVVPATTTEYTLEVKNRIGCVKQASKTINVIDIREGGKDKVFICKNGKTQSVSVNAVPAQLVNGVQLGSCNAQAKMISNEEVVGEFKVYPNPNNGKFIVEMPQSGIAEIIITDITGKVIEDRLVNASNGSVQEFNLGNAKGIYVVKTVTTERTYISKITIQ